MSDITNQKHEDLPLLKKILLAVACGITVGNVYLCQPLLDLIAKNMGVTESYAGMVPVGAQIGYASGILLVLPLADVVPTRRLLRALLLLTTVFLLVAAFSPSLPVLIAASIALTATTVVPQILIPVVASFVAPERRGRIIGTLQTGLILGILLSRTVSGSLAQWTESWRSPYFLCAVLTSMLMLVVPGQLPEKKKTGQKGGYLSLLRSLVPLLQHKPLVLSMMLGFLVFGAFSAFWATLAFHLASPAFGLGPAAAGLFGLYGAPGALMAPFAGRLSDRLGTFAVNLLALLAVMLAFLIAGIGGMTFLIALIVAVNLLDFGLQSGQIANQTRIFKLGDDIRARVNTLYMVATFSGGAIGSAIGAQAWSLAGWKGVCCVSIIMISLATIILIINRKKN
ncbi:MFS transporter [Erwinia sp. S43]|nr:MFS transporter [Erwinia sp. S43]